MVHIMVLNAAAHAVVGAGKFDHLTPVLRDVLHYSWLAVVASCASTNTV